MQGVPRGVHRVSLEGNTRIVSFAHHVSVERLDRYALGSKVGAPVGLTEGCDGSELLAQRHGHLPRCRVLDQALERPQSSARHDLSTSSAELVPAREAAMRLQDI